MPNSGFDKWTEAELRNVPLPTGFLAHLASSGPGTDDDAELDEAIRDVPLPEGLEDRLQAIARSRIISLLYWPLTTAASTLLFLGLAGILYRAMPGNSAPSSVATADSVAAVPSAPRVAEALERLEGETPEKNTQPQASASHEQIAEQQSPVEESLAPTTEEKAVQVADATAPSTDEAAEQAAAARRAARRRAQPSRLPTVKDVAAVGTAIQQATDQRRPKHAALGSAGKLDRLPELDALEAPLSRGVAPPRVRGYDLLFQLKQGEHPFVSPAAHPQLASSRVPFTFSTASYDLALRALSSGKAIAADEIRVEDFLAAVDYALPKAANQLALHAAGCRSPLGDRGLHLLQWTVQAPAEKAEKHAPTRLIVAIDVSSAMRAAARWEAVQRSLAHMAERMGTADRVTLIGFAEQAEILAEDLTGPQLQAQLASASWRLPNGLAKFGPAVELACQMAHAAKSRAAQSVVFVTAARNSLDEGALAKTGEALRGLADIKTSWEIIQLDGGSVDASSVEGRATDANLAELALAAHGKLIAAVSATDVYDALRSKLTTRPSVVAADTALKITFDPAAVTGYRLLGHAATTLTASSNDPLVIDFRADQIASAVYEVWIKGDGPRKAVATAELTWRDPTSGAQRRVVRVLGSDQLGGTFSESPAWLQQGIVAAKAAEVLSGSYYAPSTRPVSQVLELAEHIDPQIARRPSFQQLLDLLKKAN